MKLLIVTQEEPFFIPKMIRLLCKELPDSHTFKDVVILKPYHKGKSRLDWIKERANFYSPRELFLVTIAYVLSKLIDRDAHSVLKTCTKSGINVHQSLDVNSDKFISLVEKEKIDVIVSISATQIFKKKILSAPKKCCVNVHGTLLPCNRGVQGTWWALAEGYEETGATVHFINEKIDAGNIIYQEKVKITKEDTQFSLAKKTKIAGVKALLNALPLIERNNHGKPMNIKNGSFNTFPTKKDATKFREKGKRILVWDDVKFVLMKDFIVLK